MGIMGILHGVGVLSSLAVVPEPIHTRNLYLRDFSDPMNPTIDWASFMANSDLRWGTEDSLIPFPTNRNDAAWLGNGLIGTLIIKQSDAPWTLGWELGRSDVTTEIPIGTQYHYDRFRAFIGKLNLVCTSAVTNASLRYHLWDSELRGVIQTDDGEIALRSFIERDLNLLVIETEYTGSPNYSFALLEEPALSLSQQDRYAAGTLPVNETPGTPFRVNTNGNTVAVAPLSPDGHGANAVAFRQVDAGNKKTIYLSIGKTWQPAENDQSVLNMAALTEATDNVSAALSQGLPIIEARHRNWWQAYYQQSYVEFPDDLRAEQYYWININKFASLTRADYPIVIDNNGTFMTESGWAGTWWNMNVQVAYNLMFSANRLDVGYAMVNAYQTWSSNNWWQSKYYSDSFTVGRSTTYRSEAGTAQTSELGNLTWCLHNYWRYWKYSMDDRVVTGPDGVFEVLKKNVNYYLNVMGGYDGTNFTRGVKSSDGLWHLPAQVSPEYADPATGNRYFVDTNYSLQMFKWALNTLIELDDEFVLNDPDRTTWESTLNDLPSYAINTNVGAFAIAPGINYEKAHRHYSHLMAIYPLHTVNPDQGAAEEELCRKSIIDWVETYSGDYRAFTWLGASCMWATLGEGDKAYNALMELFKEPEIEPNGLYYEGSPVQESPLGAVESFNYMLLQSWGDCIRPFPATPTKWPNMAFVDLRTEGAFLVSGERKKGITRWVRIQSLAGEPCVIEPGMSAFDVTSSLGRTVTVTPVTGPRGQSRYSLDIQQGETVLLTYTGTLPPNAAPSVSLSNWTIFSGQQAGTIIGALETTDPDPGDVVQVVLTDDAGGNVALQDGKLITGAPLVAGTYPVEVQAIDVEGAKTVKSFYITVRDVQAPTFSPTNLSGCVLWLDANDLDGDGVAEGSHEAGSGDSTGMVSQWSDKSGMANHATQNDPSRQPKLEMSADVGGLSVVSNDGLDDMLVFNTITNIRTVCWVLKDDNPNRSTDLRFLLGHDQSYHFHRGAGVLFSNYASGAIKGGAGWLNKAPVNLTTDDLPMSQYCLFSLVTTGNVEANLLSGDRPPKSSAAGRYWMGDYCEVIIYDRALSDTERQQVENYLSSKWLEAASDPTLDADGDGLPNGWEAQFGDLDGESDDDLDGYSNWEEWVADTNPTNRTSRLEMDAVFAGDNQTFYFTGSSNRLYQVYFTTNSLADPNRVWWPLNSTKISGSTMGSSVQGTNAAPQGFYHLRVFVP